MTAAKDNAASTISQNEKRRILLENTKIFSPFGRRFLRYLQFNPAINAKQEIKKAMQRR